MPIVLRLVKGSELTFAELDGNFTNLDSRLDAIEIENLASRVARLETAGTPIYYDSDDTEVIFDSIWGGTVTKYLATTDSIGLASFDSDHFNVNNGHVTIKLAGYTPSDSAGIASFDSSNFVVTAGHITINPNSAAGRVAGITIIDSTGVASFDSAQFNVSSDGHVTHDEIYLDSAVRSRLSAIDNGGAGSFTYNQTLGTFIYTGAPDASTSTKGVASFNSNDFTVSAGGEVSLTGGGNTAGAVGTYALLTTKTSNLNQPGAATFAAGNTAAGSLLKTTSASGDARFGTTQTGTWRCMGDTQGAVVASEFATLFVRIA